MLINSDKNYNVLTNILTFHIPHDFEQEAFNYSFNLARSCNLNHNIESSIYIGRLAGYILTEFLKKNNVDISEDCFINSFEINKLSKHEQQKLALLQGFYNYFPIKIGKFTVSVFPALFKNKHIDIPAKAVQCGCIADFYVYIWLSPIMGEAAIMGYITRKELESAQVITREDGSQVKRVEKFHQDTEHIAQMLKTLNEQSEEPVPVKLSIDKELQDFDRHLNKSAAHINEKDLEKYIRHPNKLMPQEIEKIESHIAWCEDCDYKYTKMKDNEETISVTCERGRDITDSKKELCKFKFKESSKKLTQVIDEKENKISCDGDFIKLKVNFEFDNAAQTNPNNLNNPDYKNEMNLVVTVTDKKGTKLDDVEIMLMEVGGANREIVENVTKDGKAVFRNVLDGLYELDATYQTQKNFDVTSLRISLISKEMVAYGLAGQFLIEQRKFANKLNKLKQGIKEWIDKSTLPQVSWAASFGTVKACATETLSDEDSVVIIQRVIDEKLFSIYKKEHDINVWVEQHVGTRFLQDSDELPLKNVIAFLTLLPQKDTELNNFLDELQNRIESRTKNQTEDQTEELSLEMSEFQNYKEKSWYKALKDYYRHERSETGVADIIIKLMCRDNYGYYSEIKRESTPAGGGNIHFRDVKDGSSIFVEIIPKYTKLKKEMYLYSFD